MVYENEMKIVCVDEETREKREMSNHLGRADVLITE